MKILNSLIYESKMGRETKQSRVFDKEVMKNFPKLIKFINPRIQKAKWKPDPINLNEKPS